MVRLDFVMDKKWEWIFRE